LQSRYNVLEAGLPHLARLKAYAVEQNKDNFVTLRVSLNTANALTQRRVSSNHAAFNLNVLGTSRRVADGVVTRGAGADKPQVEALCRDIFRNLPRDAERLFCQLIVFDREPLYLREDFLDSLDVAHTVSHAIALPLS